MFPVIQVEGQDFEFFEQLGSKQKFWYDELKYLFKRGRKGTGENWAEVVAASIAEALGLPHAEYQLARTAVVEEIWDGVVTPNFVPVGGRLVLGNELIMPPISRGERATSQTRREHHTVNRLMAVFRLPFILPPVGWGLPAAVAGARGTMAGYLLLDALIGNQDRHEENWGLVVLPDRRIHLAPTFDHASSLGRNETDATRQVKLMATRPEHGVEGYAARANSQLYGRNGRRLKNMELVEEFCKAEPSSCRYWLDKLRPLDEQFFRRLLNSVPDDWITPLARDFAIAMLMNNRRKLLEMVP